MSRDAPGSGVTREDYLAALREQGTYLDISLDDLMDLHRRAERHASQRATEAIAVERLMTRDPVSVRPDTRLATAAHRLIEHRISGLPVTDEQGRLCGIITEADFLRALGVPAHHPGHSLWQTLEGLFSHLGRHTELQAPAGRVRDLMVTDLVTVGPDADLHQVLALMKTHRVKRVLVCDAQHRLLGILTRSDLVRVFFDRYLQASEAAE